MKSDVIYYDERVTIARIERESTCFALAKIAHKCWDCHQTITTGIDCVRTQYVDSCDWMCIRCALKRGIAEKVK